MTKVLFQIEGNVARIRLNRPESLNAIDAKMNAALRDAWLEVNANPNIRVAMLSAEGERAFCVGADLKSAPCSGERIAFGGGITGIGGPLLAVTKPVVAAVSGLVLGGGFELVMCADIIVASDTAQFGLPETALGVIGECGVVHRAVRQLPYRVALGMILTGERLQADKALQCGLINQLVEAGALDEAAEQWCERILAASPLAVQAVKEAALSRIEFPLSVALATRFEKIEGYLITEDCAEGRKAFSEKRRPIWKGR